MGNNYNIVYIAARLAKEQHKGQVDKGGADYFSGHLCSVAKQGDNHLEKTVGFLHDAAEDTDITVEEIMEKLRSSLSDWINNPNDKGWTEEFINIIGFKPSEIPQDLSVEEWKDIETSLNTLNHHSAPTREEYIENFRGHTTAIKVKLNDLRNNMDLSRIENLTQKDKDRLERYRQEYDKLIEMLAIK